MPITCSGVIRDPSGTPIANMPITIVAIGNSPLVLDGTTIRNVTDMNGAYSFPLNPAKYGVTIHYGVDHYVGEMYILQTSVDGNLNDFLLNTTIDDAVTESMAEFQKLRNETVKASEDAKTAVGGLGMTLDEAKELNKFTHEIGTADENTDVPDPLDPTNSVPSLQKFMKEKAELYKHEFKTFDNGGPWKPTASAEYPDVTGVTTNMTYQIDLERDGSYAFTTSDLTGEITFAGDDLNYDFAKNSWSLVKQGTAGNRLVILPNPDNYQTIRVNQGNVFHLKLNAPQCQLVFSGVDTLAAGFSQIVLILEQGTGANKVQWPANIEWAYSRAPVLSFEKGKQDIVTLFKMYNVDKWYGVFSGGWFNV